MGFDVLAESTGEGMVDVDEVLTSAVCDVKGLAGSFVGSETGFEIGFDDILNVGEVTALTAVTVDGGTLVIQQLFDELWNNGGIGSVGVLTAPENVKVPETVGVDTIVAAVLLGPFLITTLGEGVGRE